LTLLLKEKQSGEVRKLEDKVVNGIIHCANYVCNGCPYKPAFDDGATETCSSASSYVRCMQRLIEDIYKNIKEVEE
jgi:hypothetical protein